VDPVRGHSVDANGRVLVEDREPNPEFEGRIIIADPEDRYGSEENPSTSFVR
jgi:hypothetical protein